MKANLVALLVVALLLSSLRAEEEPSDREKLFEKGIELAKSGKFAEAHELYRRILEFAPEDTGALYNAGFCCSELQKFPEAIGYFTLLKALQPDNVQARSKLIQAHQSMGKPKERDREIRELYRLRKETKVEGLRKRKFYCRDRFRVGTKKVFAFEHFELVGDRAVKLMFTVNDEKGEKVCYLSLGSYETTNQMMQDLGELKEGERGYHLDGQYPWGHATYRFFHGEPDYDKLRALIVSIVKGEMKPQSSSRLPEKEPEEGGE